MPNNNGIETWYFKYQSVNNPENNREWYLTAFVVLGMFWASGDISLRYISISHDEGTSIQIFPNENQNLKKYATQDVGWRCWSTGLPVYWWLISLSLPISRILSTWLSLSTDYQGGLRMLDGVNLLEIRSTVSATDHFTQIQFLQVKLIVQERKWFRREKKSLRILFFGQRVRHELKQSNSTNSCCSSALHAHIRLCSVWVLHFCCHWPRCSSGKLETLR